MSATTVVWFRRDLRTADHRALAWAAARGRVVCLWVADPALLARAHHRAPARLRFLAAGLRALDDELRGLGVPLVVRTGDPAAVLAEVAAATAADAVAWSAEVSPWGRARDRRVAAALAAAGVAALPHPGELLVEPEDLPGPSGRGYRVFGAFQRAWMDRPLPEHLPAPTSLSGPVLDGDGWHALTGDAPALPAGPAAARAALVAAIQDGRADGYAAARDDLAADATTRLSAYLRFGMCTAAQVGRALGVPHQATPGRWALWRQICWREFFHHHMAHHPGVARGSLRPALHGLVWDDDPRLIDAWREGRTGYPLVDAGMRQLAATGFMHNRARMVTASFLVKDLLTDWRIGERVFMQRLVDGDPASNNGGWQWVAGTGTDAAPFHRVLNPVLQARRFDPDGTYVRRWLPELAGVPTAAIHEPWRMNGDDQRAAGCVLGRDYPFPVVDHRERRLVALERFRAAVRA